MSDEEQPTARIGSEFLPRPCGYLPPHAFHQHLQAVVQTCTMLEEASLSLRREKQQLLKQRNYLLEKRSRVVQAQHDLTTQMTSYE